MRRSMRGALTVLVLFGVWACDSENDVGQGADDMGVDAGADLAEQADLEGLDVNEQVDMGVPESDIAIVDTSESDDGGGQMSDVKLVDSSDDVPSVEDVDETDSLVEDVVEEQDTQDVMELDTTEPDMMDPDMMDPDTTDPDTTDPDTMDPDVTEPAPTLSELTTTIFLKSCATAGCHTNAAKKGSLNFQAEDIWSQLVDVQAKAAASKKRVVAGSPDLSFLIQKMENKQAPTEGVRMPPAPFPLLAKEKVDSVRAWIEAGALNN